MYKIFSILSKKNGRLQKMTCFIFAKDPEYFFELIFLVTIIQLFVHHHAGKIKMIVHAMIY